jgi:hypothetical protein
MYEKKNCVVGIHRSALFFGILLKLWSRADKAHVCKFFCAGEHKLNSDGKVLPGY